MSLKIILAGLDKGLLRAWEDAFIHCKDVTLHEGDITKLECDAVVSPANSFGFMDGGLDYALSERFGWDLEKKVQALIKALPEGELLVGRSLVVETGDKMIPLLISAPTMRIPTNFNISTSVNAYLAMKAILIAATSDARIRSVAIPGLCTGVGGMEQAIAATQMFAAYKEIILGQRMDFNEFGEAQKYHWNLNATGMIWTY